MRRVTRLGAALAALLSAVALGACGGGGGGGGDKAKPSPDAGEGKTGGKITVLGSAYPDFLDPQLAITVDAIEVLSQVYPGLVTFPHEAGQAGAEVVPGLAEDMPELSNGNKTYTFTLRENLKYSDGSAVKASDFTATVKRLLKQDSVGSNYGFTSIVGGAEYLDRKRGDIPGIKTDDEAGTIEITLNEPRGYFVYEMALWFASPVPADTPAENQTKNPPPGTGRYQITDVEVNRSARLVKNPNFSESLKGTAVDAGKVDEIDYQIERELSNAATKVSQGSADFMIDIPPADRLPEIKARYKDRYHEFPTNSTFYFFLNTETEPFDDLKVRQAVNHAIDVKALNRIHGGVLAPANNILPPGVPGFEKTEDLYPFDMNKARRLIKEAGAEGEQVTVWGNPESVTKRTVEYYADVLNQIGLEAKTRIIPAETYFSTIGDRSTKAQTGWANWFQDYPHPADFIDVLVNPDNVGATGNNNYSYNAKDKELARKINEASAQPELTDEVKAQWAALDREIQQKAYWAPYGNRKQATFMSERMDFENCKGEHPVWTHDWSQFCLK
jgi:peptide/nickel transport system substrate-binding protein